MNALEGRLGLGVLPLDVDRTALPDRETILIE